MRAISRSKVRTLKPTPRLAEMTQRLTDHETAERIAGFYELVDQFERGLIERALDQARGNIGRAARALRLSTTALELKIERLAVSRTSRVTPKGEW